MSRRTLAVLLVALLALAGCTAAPGAPTETTEPADSSTPADTPAGETPPGVADGRLANASALVQAHETALAERGFAASVTRSVNGTDVASYDVVAAPGLATYTLGGTRTAGDAGTTAVSLWANESIRLVKYTSDGESRYQATKPEAEHASPYPLGSVARHLRAGDFTVAEESTAEGETVLVADDVVPDAGEAGRFADAESFEGRAVVDASGRVRSLNVTVAGSRDTVSITFELRRTAVESVDRPAWVQDIPADAMVTPQLAVDVRDGRVLTVRNEAGDPVPANATIVVTTNDTTYSAAFDAPLPPGEGRYAAIAASDGTLRLSADEPDAADVVALESPVSVTVETEGGVTLLSVGMGWGSESASGGEAER